MKNGNGSRLSGTRIVLIYTNVFCLLAQKLAQWRREKHEEALKKTVLDEDTAAQFSTAAALAAQRDKRGALRNVDWRTNTLEAPEHEVGPHYHRGCIG